MSARKKPKGVDETPEGHEVAEGTVLADSVAEDSALDAPVIDPELDRVTEESVDEPDVVDDQDDSEASGRSGKGKLALGAVLALVVAAGAVWAAGAIAGSGEAGLPETVSDPTVVIAALQEGGIECSGTAVAGDVATCNSTVAVRLFDSASDAEDWISTLLKDPQTSSAIGWVRHGNVVVAGPLNGAPDVSAVLGTGSQIY